MATMRPPHVPETPPNVYTDDEIHRLLAACEGRTFEDRRDMAIVRHVPRHGHAPRGGGWLAAR